MAAQAPQPPAAATLALHYPLIKGGVGKTPDNFAEPGGPLRFLQKWALSWQLLGLVPRGDALLVWRAGERKASKPLAAWLMEAFGPADSALSPAELSLPVKDRTTLLDSVWACALAPDRKPFARSLSLLATQVRTWAAVAGLDVAGCVVWRSGYCA